jgi:hypothetical protein
MPWNDGVFDPRIHYKFSAARRARYARMNPPSMRSTCGETDRNEECLSFCHGPIGEKNREASE